MRPEKLTFKITQVVSIYVCNSGNEEDTKITNDLIDAIQKTPSTLTDLEQHLDEQQVTLISRDFGDFQIPCSNCHGNGYTVTPFRASLKCGVKLYCMTCYGTGFVKKDIH